MTRKRKNEGLGVVAIALFDIANAIRQEAAATRELVEQRKLEWATTEEARKAQVESFEASRDINEFTLEKLRLQVEQALAKGAE